MAEVRSCSCLNERIFASVLRVVVHGTVRQHGQAADECCRRTVAGWLEERIFTRTRQYSSILIALIVGTIVTGCNNYASVAETAVKTARKA